jgi:hypothetical protein
MPNMTGLWERLWADCAWVLIYTFKPFFSFLIGDISCGVISFASWENYTEELMSGGEEKGL